MGFFFQYYFKRQQLFAIFYTVESHVYQDDFFPAFFQSKYSIILAYILPIAFGLPLFLRGSVVACRVHAIACLVSAAILMTHATTFHDAVYLCQFWLSLWLLWYAFRDQDSLALLSAKAPFLFLCIVSLIFLGGAVGKFCEVYWQGELVYVNFIEAGNNIAVEYLKTLLSVPSQMELAKWASRFLTSIEFLTAFVLFLPPVFGLAWVIFVVLGMTVSLGVGMLSLTAQFLMIALANVFLLWRQSLSNPHEIEKQVE